MKLSSRPRRAARPVALQHSMRARISRWLGALLCLCLGSLMQPVAAAPPPASQTRVVGNPPRHSALPATRLRHTRTAYTHWLNQIAQRNDVAGLATAIVVDGRVRFERTIGYADTHTGERVTPTTVFRLASLSKAFATAMTGLLVRAGRLNWDTTLINVLPFFKLKNMQQAHQATVRDILGQRLGLPRNTFDLKLEDDVPYEALVRELDKVKMTCPVGHCYSYQNVAFSLIGDVIYARTGDFFAHEVEKHIFLPLGMTTATYGLHGLENSRRWARPHRHSGDGWAPFLPKDNYYHVAPAAGVNASLRDMEQWTMAQLGSRPDVLPNALLDVLHSPVINTPSETWATPWRRKRVDHAHYALGWRVYDYAGTRVIFHAGAVHGYRTMIALLPHYDSGVVIMWNCSSLPASGLMPMVLDSLLGLPHVDWAGLDKHAPRHHRHRRRHR